MRLVQGREEGVRRARGAAAARAADAAGGRLGGKGRGEEGEGMMMRGKDEGMLRARRRTKSVERAMQCGIKQLDG